MKKVGVLLLVSLLLVSPVAYAFSFSDVFEFIGNIFGSENEITGYAGKGKAPSCSSSGSSCGGKNPSCCSGLSCVSGTCQTPAVCGNGNTESGEQCDDGRDNTNTPCSANYDSSCTYCDTSCVSHTITGASCGDSNCDEGSETCSSCEADCGACVTFDAAPTVSLSVSDFTAGSSIPSLTITNGIKCAYSVFEFSVSEASTRRGASTRKLEIFINEPIDCDGAQSTLSSKLDVLPTGNYETQVEAKNNQGTTTGSNTFSVTGGSITITTPKISYTYTTDDKPKATVSVSGNPSSCSWSVNGGSATSFGCSSGLSNTDISAASDDGINTLLITVDGESAERDYMYYKTATFVGQEIAKASGVSSGGGSMGVLISGIESDAAAVAYVGMLKNIKDKGAASLAERNTLMDTLSLQTKNAIATIASEKGIDQLKIGAYRATEITELTAGDVHTQIVNLIESNKAAETYGASSNSHEHKITATTSGGGIVHIKIESDPIEFDLAEGECNEVDVNADELQDVIVCYEEGSVTVDNIVFVDSTIDSAYNEETTVLFPYSITTTKKYELPFDENTIISKITQKYVPILSVMGTMIVALSFISIRSLFLTRQKPKRKKRK